MTRDQTILLLLQRAGQRQSDTTLANQLIGEMVLVQETTLEQGALYPFFLLTEQVSSPMAAFANGVTK